MKFSVAKSELYNSLHKIIGVVPQKTTIAVLNCLLMEVENNQLNLTGTDLEISVTTSLPVEGSENGIMAVPARLLADIVKELPDVPLTLYSHEGNKLVIETEKGEYKIATQPKEDFPKINVEESVLTLDLSSDKVIHLINKTIFAVSADELRPALTGINMELLPDELRFVATDGHRLSKIVFSNFDSPVKEKRNFIIPTKTLNLLLRNVENDDRVNIQIGEDHIVFQLQTATIYSKLINGAYPNYERVIPTDNDKRLVVNRDLLLATLRRVSIFSSSLTRQVRLVITPNELTIRSEDIEFGAEAKEMIPASFSAEWMQIGYNSNYFIDILRHVDGEEVIIELKDSMSAAVMFPSEQQEKEEHLMLLMPIRINEESYEGESSSEENE
ncbi:MAG TPA: DNA polymerase III subunit beta [bacterium]|nr:DNA polymerase III subunit beta [bacterium]HPG44609.1 DNA polymerase III subunit beta [bacterium]HPM97167.1 DNA polymerase III subunit beta [bacterium]